MLHVRQEVENSGPFACKESGKISVGVLHRLFVIGLQSYIFQRVKPWPEASGAVCHLDSGPAEKVKCWNIVIP